jgi:hypothetical protein
MASARESSEPTSKRSLALCVYCGYANGVIAYARKIASRTEQYWCPIKHALRIRDPHVRYAQFLEYGDAGRVSLKAFGASEAAGGAAARDSFLIHVACADLSFRKRFESQPSLRKAAALVG